MKLVSLSCNGCGAPLDNTLVCKYCQGNHRLTGVEKHSNQSIGSYDDPIIITIENTGSVIRNAEIFRYDKDINGPFYGNHHDIIIKCIQPLDISNYGALLRKISSKPIEVGLFRFSSTNQMQLREQLSILEDERPTTLMLYLLKDPYAYCNSIVQYKKTVPILLNGINHIGIPILPQTTLEITMFPRIKTYINSTTNRTQEIFRYRGPKPLPLHFL